MKDDNKYKEIEQIIMSKSVRIRNVLYLYQKSSHRKILVGSTRPKKKWLCFKDHADVEEYLSRIYDARSSALHEGNLFHLHLGK